MIKKLSYYETSLFSGRWEKMNGNYLAALNILIELAEYGMPQAMYEIAELYELGLGTKQDNTESEKWYKKACDKGFKQAFPGAIFQKFEYYKQPKNKLYKEGELLRENTKYDEACYFYRLAALKRHANAAFEVGNLYFNKLVSDIDENFTKTIMYAKLWYRMAGNLGKREGKILVDKLDKMITHDLIINQQNIDEILDNSIFG
jgi:TPR repeat protein